MLLPPPPSSSPPLHHHSLLPRDPEFSATPRLSPERARARELPSLNNSVVISSGEWGRIREAARALTKEEVAGEKEPESRPSPWAVRRAIPLPERPEVEVEEREEPREQAAILERAQRLREENAEEVRKLNELILSAKCNAVLDNQV